MSETLSPKEVTELLRALRVQLLAVAENNLTRNLPFNFSIECSPESGEPFDLDGGLDLEWKWEPEDMPKLYKALTRTLKEHQWNSLGAPQRDQTLTSPKGDRRLVIFDCGKLEQEFFLSGFDEHIDIKIALPKATQEGVDFAVKELVARITDLSAMTDEELTSHYKKSMEDQG